MCEEGTNFFLENCQFEIVKVPVYFTSQILKTRAKGTDCFEVAVNPDMCQSAIIGSHNL